MATSSPQLAPGWLTGDQAAQLAGITPASFRKEVMRKPQLAASKQMLGPLACYPTKVVKAWLATRTS